MHLFHPLHKGQSFRLLIPTWLQACGAQQQWIRKVPVQVHILTAQHQDCMHSANTLTLQVQQYHAQQDTV